MSKQVSDSTSKRKLVEFTQEAQQMIDASTQKAEPSLDGRRPGAFIGALLGVPEKGQREEAEPNDAIVNSGGETDAAAGSMAVDEVPQDSNNKRIKVEPQGQPGENNDGGNAPYQHPIMLTGSDGSAVDARPYLSEQGHF